MERRIHTIPQRFRSTGGKATSSVVEMSEWETIPDVVHEQLDMDLRHDLGAGESLPPTYMHNETTGAAHTVTLAPDKTHFKQRSTDHTTIAKFSRMGPPNRASQQVFRIKAIIVQTVNPTTHTSRGKRRRTQTQYLAIFDGVYQDGVPYPPEWQPKKNLQHGDPEADYLAYLAATCEVRGSHSTLNQRPCKHRVRIDTDPRTHARGP